MSSNPYEDQMPPHLRRETIGDYDLTLRWVNATYVDVPTPERDLAERKRRARVALEYERRKAPEAQHPVLLTQLGVLA